MKSGVINPFGRALAQYFAHWKNMTVEYRITLFKKIKQQVVKVYFNKLRHAFEQLKAKGTLKRKKKRLVENLQMESEKAEMEEDLLKTTTDIQAKEVRSLNRGHVKLRRMILKARTAELSFRFQQWRHRTGTQKADSKLVTRALFNTMKKRLYKQALNRFTRKHKELVREEQVVKKADNLADRFTVRKLTKFFNMFAVNCNRSKEAKRAFKGVLERELFRHLKDYITRWKRHTQKENVEVVKRKQMQVEEQVEEVVAAQNDEHDIIFKQEQQRTEMVRSHKQLGRKVLKSTIAAWRNYRYQWAFYRWKEAADHSTKQQRGLKQEILVKFTHRLLHNAFSHWRLNHHALSERKKLFGVRCEQENEKREQNRIANGLTNLAQTREKTAFQLEQIRMEQDYKKKLIKNQVARAVSDRTNNFIIPRKEHIF